MMARNPRTALGGRAAGGYKGDTGSCWLQWSQGG